ncbi:MAG: tetratricopeptide repeat protein [Candidatus Microthrix sp.]|nr:tetratricopeptide repeat protein [Candidatus Microthrix sp.]
MTNLANRLAATGDRAGALPPAQEAVTLRRAQAEQNPAYQPDLAAALNNLAITLAETGDRAGALPSPRSRHPPVPKPNRTPPTNPTSPWR